MYFVLLDEVTGLSFNTQKHIMQEVGPQTYSVTLPFSIGQVLKYRYSRISTASIDEQLYTGHPVRYRLYFVGGPATVEDIVSRWSGSQDVGPTGQITGKVTDSSTGAPVPSLMVTAGGAQSLTSADGTFLLESLPPGTHTLVIYAMDGTYHTFQQGAVVQADSTTPVEVQLSRANLVTVIFTARLPGDTPPDAEVRLAGNLYQLGNTFTSLAGGVSTLASRMPVMGRLADGRYMLTMTLPEGAYIEYKYTLGDGLWSSEISKNGGFNLRKLLVPSSNLEQDDTVERWLSQGTRAIHFEVAVPADTPPDEVVSIQFNAGFGWMEPLRMHPLANSQVTAWEFDLTGPFNALTSLPYRYCRQEQCGAADDSATMGIYAGGRAFDPSASSGEVKDTVSSWAWLQGASQPVVVPGSQVAPRDQGFIAGVSFQTTYHPSYGPLLPGELSKLNQLKVNRVILRPTWTFTSINPPILEPVPSQDMPWPELVNLVKDTPRTQFSIGLFPFANFPMPTGLWWQRATRDYPWWMAFFEQYSNYILHYATIASYNAEPLILGGDWLNPALPGGVLADGSPSNIPQDAEARWRELIGQVRQRYPGPLGWVLSYPNGLQNPPPFLDAIDQIYLLWSAPLASQPGSPPEELQAQAGSILDQEVKPFQEQVGKPLILALSYPAIDQAATGCIEIAGGGCLGYNLLAPPNPDIPELGLNLLEQANAYNAILSAVNERPWISGFLSMGYYPPAVLLDKSTSVHGKPAASVVTFWSEKFLGR